MHKRPHGRNTLVGGDPGIGLGPEGSASGVLPRLRRGQA